MQPPVVALTATTKMIDGLERVRLNDAYVRAVRDAGLVPLVLAPVDVAALDAVLDAVAGVVITGGEDVDPREYGEAARPETHAPHSARDRCELTLVSRAHERRVPTLAICRGIQVVNVALGGTLVQDIAAECPAALDHDQSRRRTERVHDVSIERDSRLAQAIGGTRIAVNSSHHQSLARVADGLRVTAHASDRIVEGAEWTGDDWWMIGVQWHPEELVHAPEAWDRNLFAAFAAAVSAG
ncbi:MAG TPA: gamma-glutamyl-gamma-aminobutyrate hydrolase family protein [Gemmatimonadaceae bacterium]|nr:gamma-glutamyl-gamma-aminobutyrate hydrolase family protein [Gemmatimonadaceae bacterium]